MFFLAWKALIFTWSLSSDSRSSFIELDLSDLMFHPWAPTPFPTSLPQGSHCIIIISFCVCLFLALNVEYLGIFISCDCCNKLPLTWWLKTTHVVLRIPKSVSLGQNQRVGRAALPPWLLGENLSLAFSSFGWLWHSLAWRHITPISASIVPAPSLSSVCVNLPAPPSYKDTCNWM